MIHIVVVDCLEDGARPLEDGEGAAAYVCLVVSNRLRQPSPVSEARRGISGA